MSVTGSVYSGCHIHSRKDGFLHRILPSLKSTNFGRIFGSGHSLFCKMRVVFMRVATAPPAGYGVRSSISTRLFSARPLSVSLEPIGRLSA